MARKSLWLPSDIPQPPSDPLLVNLCNAFAGNEIEVARRAGVHPQTLRYWANGHTKGPRLTTILRVAHALTVDLTLTQPPNVYPIRRKA